MVGRGALLYDLHSLMSSKWLDVNYFFAGIKNKYFNTTLLSDITFIIVP